jgi:hypothetical protein
LSATPAHLPLPAGFKLSMSQAEVDFVIPDLATDIPVCIDPFLLYKSRDATLRALHDQLLAVFSHGFSLYEAKDRKGLDRLINFPEVNAIGFGYTQGGIHGSGLGWHLNQLVADLLESSEEVRVRGLKHVEELQLLSVGVGPDRVSDIAAGVLKTSLIDYTQQQAQIWKIPITASVPIAHYLDPPDMEWRDGYFDLPVNPLSGLPLLLVPRRIVRLLPWINYPDFYSNEAKLLLPPQPRLPRFPGMTKVKRLEVAKAELVQKARQKPEVLEQYIGRKEHDAANAEPLLPDSRADEELKTASEDLRAKLKALPTGAAASGDYQRLVYEILNFLFEPELTGGEFEVSTYMGTERRDLIYWNEAEHSFWKYVRGTYNSPLLMFECKNTAALEIDHINQTAAYLGARLGMLGIIATRSVASDAVMRKIYSIYNDSAALPRKVILVFSDADMDAMLAIRASGQSPVPYAQNLYRQLRSKVQ